jgi:hypothetical protein
LSSRIANNTITIFANINAYKTLAPREKDDVKEFSRIAANTARTLQGNCQIIGQHKERKTIVHGIL